jgi:hypothetical protein
MQKIELTMQKNDMWRTFSAQHLLRLEQGEKGRAGAMEGPCRGGAVGVACKNVEHLKEHGDRWKLNEELESPVVEAHSTPKQLH